MPSVAARTLRPSEGPARATAPAPYPSIKLVPPALPAHLVPRLRLREVLERSERPITLLSSHAGTGKTVLLSSWAGAEGENRVAWLGLDRDDNWSPRFWLGVERALGGARPGAFTPRGGEPGPAAVLAFAERLDSSQPLALVLDDLHEIENQVVLRELQELLDHAPRQLRVVLSTRADPPLRLQRLRLTEDLTEIRAADLAFTLDECRALLGPDAEDLTDEDVETLRSRTEGWAAGLRFASLSLAAEPDRAGFLRRFAGDDRAVADYLINEVLDRQTEQRREFLLRTSVPDVLTAELADELTGRRDAGRVLAALEAANLVVSNRTDAEVRYRYHGLLLEFLRAEIRRTRPRDLSLLYRLSARWHWARREPIPSFRDAVAGSDWDLADEIAGAAWHVVATDAGRAALGRVPADALAGHPCLCLQAALACLWVGERQEAERRLSMAVLDLAETDVRNGARVLRLQVEAALARLDGDFDGLGRLAWQLLDAPDGDGFDTAASSLAQRATALSHLGAAEVTRGELPAAEGHLEIALDIARRTGLCDVALEVLSELALLEATRGRLRRAVELATEAAALADLNKLTERAPAVTARLVLGWAYLQWDELSVAEQHLGRAAAAASKADRTGRVAATVLSALVVSAEGSRDVGTAVVRLRGATSELDGRPIPARLAVLLETAEARLLTARGDLQGARRALERWANGSGAGAVVRARLLLAEGKPEEALQELDGFGEADRLALQIEAEVLTSVARHALHDVEGSGRALEQALELAGPNNYRRPFLDGGPVVRALLVQRIRRGTANRALVAELLAAFEKRAPSVEITRAELLEPLSERETAVLRYLPTMMSNVEIAGELFVTSNTVKTHLKSIYRKLGVARRRDAVERARKLELL